MLGVSELYYFMEQKVVTSKISITVLQIIEIWLNLAFTVSISEEDALLPKLQLCHWKYYSTQKICWCNHCTTTVMSACPPTCRLRWAGAVSFLALCWPSPRAWASSSSNSCCRVASAGSEQPGKNQSSSISFVPQGKGKVGLDWGCIYGWEVGIKWTGQNDGRVKDFWRHFLKTGWQRWKEDKKCDGTDGVCGFDKEGNEALSTPQIHFVT